MPVRRSAYQMDLTSDGSSIWSKGHWTYEQFSQALDLCLNVAPDGPITQEYWRVVKGNDHNREYHVAKGPGPGAFPVTFCEKVREL